MSFFAKLKEDVEAVESKIRSLIVTDGPIVTHAVKDETLAILSRLIAYVEARLPEIESVVAAAADKLVPGLGAVVAEAAAAPKVEQAIDAENPKP